MDFHRVTERISEGFVIVARYINDKAFHLEERIECGAGFCVLSLLKIVRGHKKKASLGQTLIIKPPAGFSGTWSENLQQPVRGQPGGGAHCFFAILLLYFDWHHFFFLSCSQIYFKWTLFIWSTGVNDNKSWHVAKTDKKHQAADSENKYILLFLRRSESQFTFSFLLCIYLLSLLSLT